MPNNAMSKKRDIDFWYLKNLGLSITVKNEDLIIKPKDKLTPELIEAIKKNKQKIMKQLADDVLKRALKGKLEPNDPNYITIFSEKLNRYIHIALDSDALIKLANRNKQAIKKVPVFHIDDVIEIARNKPDKETLERLCVIAEVFNS